MSMEHNKRFFRDKRGASLVESAIAASLCLSAFLWMMEMCFTMYCQSILSNAAKQGLAYAITHGAVAYKNTGNGSGPGTNDPTGTQGVNPASQAWFAQSALKSSLPDLSICTGWWAPGTSTGGFKPSQCSGHSSTYVPTATNAEPGTVVTVQITWPYKPYVKLPWIPATLSYTGTGVVAY